ncbi:MAG: head GIN domain-containing protein [Ginsengibacter sp.]
MRSSFTIIFLSILFGSCGISIGNSYTGNGNIKTETRNVGSFDGIQTSGSIDIEITPGDRPEVSVEDDENILPLIETEVIKGILHVSYRDDVSVRNDHAKVYVSTPNLQKIISSGSANIVFEEGLTSDKNLEITVRGSGDVDGAIDAPGIIASVSGSGNIKLRGRTRDLQATCSGSGGMNLIGLKSENVKVKVSGSGNAKVFASVHLEARVSGSGDISYGGNPSSPEIHTSGSGTVRPE